MSHLKTWLSPPVPQVAFLQDLREKRARFPDNKKDAAKCSALLLACSKLHSVRRRGSGLSSCEGARAHWLKGSERHVNWV